MNTTSNFTVNGNPFTLAGIRIYYLDGTVRKSLNGSTLSEIITWALTVPSIEVQCINVYATETYSIFVTDSVITHNYKLPIDNNDYFWITDDGNFGGGFLEDIPLNAAVTFTGSLPVISIINTAMNDEVW